MGPPTSIMLQRFSTCLVTALLLVGCGGDDRDRRSDSPPNASAQASVLESLDDAASTYTGSSRDLLDLLVGPGAVAGHRLAFVRVDDPNGNGRIDGRWYPPRLVRAACSVKLDHAPMPVVGVALVPGDAAEPPNANELEASRELLEAPYSISLSVQLFDDSGQRDAFAATTEQLYGEMNSFSFTKSGCGSGSGSTGGGLAVLKRVDAYDAGYPGFSMTGRLIISRTFLVHYRVGERVLLSIAVQSSITESDVPSDELDTSFIEPLIAAQVERLRAKGLG